MKYQRILEALGELQKLVRSYYTYNEYGDQPKLEEEDIEELKKNYNDVFNIASEYLESVEESNIQAEKANIEHADRIQEQLQKDMTVLQTIKPGMTLPSAMKYSNNKVVNITGKKFKELGAGSNRRQLMTITGPDGKPLKGVFTERTHVGFNVANAPYYAELLSRQMPEFREMFEYLTPLYFSENPSQYGLEHRNNEDIEKRFGKIENYQEAVRLFNVLCTKLTRSAEKVNLNTGERNSVSRFDTRNVAFSNVAYQLGMDQKIARSTTMTIRNNGNDLHGSFMEFAKGEDPCHAKVDGNLKKVTETSFDNSEVLKTLSDIQVLDYICGNTDRHGYNLFYTVDENGKVTDVMGIDNDMSFGWLPTDYMTPYSSGLDTIYHMSKSMYEKVMRFDEHMLLHSLDGLGLEKKNQDFTVERLKGLKEKINEGKVAIIEDKDYEKFKLSDFIANRGDKNRTFEYKGKQYSYENNFSIYRNVEKLSRSVHIDKSEYLEESEEVESDTKEMPEEGKENQPVAPNNKKINNSNDQLQMEEAATVKVEDLEMGEDSPQIITLKDKMKRAESHVFFGSEQFDKVKKGLEKLERATELVGKNEKFLTVTNVKIMHAGYQHLFKLCNDYLKYKEEQGKLDCNPLSKTGKRIEAVRAVSDFCKGRMETLYKSIEMSVDKEREDTLEVNEMKNEAQKIMIENMKPNEVGEYMKSLIGMHAQNPDDKDMTVKLGQKMSMCREYMMKKGADIAQYNITKEDISKCKALLKDSRLANIEKKERKPEEIRDHLSKAAILG